MIFMGIAAFGAFVTFMPWLKIGPEATSLVSWTAGVAGQPAGRALYDSKIALLSANLRRLLVIRIFFTIQTATTIVALAVALSYSAWK
jgi:hypothetical protein